MDKKELMEWLEKNNIGYTVNSDMDYKVDRNRAYLYDLHTAGYFGKATKVFIRNECTIELFCTGIN